MFRVGVIGGGQLARMMLPPAVALGIDFRVLAETENESASIAPTVVGNYRDVQTVLDFAADSDVITFDHEHVPLPVLTALSQAGISVHPGVSALAIAQDKTLMRQKLRALGVPTPEWALAHAPEDLHVFLGKHNGIAVVKLPRGGYDGRGVRVVRAANEVDDWFGGSSLLLEEFVPFRRELAQLVARRPSGQMVSWPLVESVQKDGVCVQVVAPAPNADSLTDQARAIAETVASELGVTGVLAVELFETTQGKLLVNELAMRPHNTGHWSIDASLTSQFEQHLRAILDLPLGATDALAKVAVMVNLFGSRVGEQMSARFARIASAYPEIKLHSYRKEPKPGRKIGHLTALGTQFPDTLQRARVAAELFGSKKVL